MTRRSVCPARPVDAERVRRALAAAGFDATVTRKAGRIVIEGVGVEKLRAALATLAAMPQSEPENGGPCPACGGGHAAEVPVRIAEAAPAIEPPSTPLTSEAFVTAMTNLGEIFADHERNGCPEIGALDACIPPAIFQWWQVLGPAGQQVVACGFHEFVTAYDQACQQLQAGTASPTLVALNRDARTDSPKRLGRGSRTKPKKVA
jgi:hypothetical protein